MGSVRRNEAEPRRGEDPNWISPRFDIKDVEGKATFTIDGVAIEAIVKEVAPPFFVYSAGDIKDKYTALRDALVPAGIDVYFSMKTNTSQAVVAGLSKMGAGLEVASIGELLMAQEVYADPKRVSFAGPVKTDEELEKAIEWGVGAINVESEEEFSRIDEIAESLGKIQRVGIRVNPKSTISKAGGTMGGGQQKFGIDEEKLTPEFIGKIGKLSNVQLVGVHVFSATQMLDAEEFLGNFRNILSIARRLNNSFPVEYIDFGGGLGIPYSPDKEALPLDEISTVIKSALLDFPFVRNQSVHMYFEPGRYLVGASGVYIAEVDHVKESRGKTFVMVNGGWHHEARPAPKMNFGIHPAYNVSRPVDFNKKIMTIAGSLCTSIDILGEDVDLPIATKRGDLIGIFNAGAYGKNQSPQDFLSHPKPAEILTANGNWAIVREAEHPQDYLFRGQIIPENASFE